MNILDSIVSPDDIKNFDYKSLNDLCGELRHFLLSNVSKTGGHLASNLGVIEITVAIHKVFDTSKDRLVFDVGHQCYAHKILTGRKEGFNNLRGMGGVSGFPRPDESIHDSFISGHASTSVSVALGMARARTALGKDYNVIALIGDGALTGGLAYEALSDAGNSGEPLIIILNDNEMSITKNVGGLAMHLARLRVRPQYFTLKKFYRRFVAKIPGGKSIDRFFRKIKTGIKNALLPSSMFESMGFVYLGPSDGHNIQEICRLLTIAKELAKPVIIHLTTTKGKGYKYSEESPEAYHGVSCFNVTNGEPLNIAKRSFSSAFGDAITELAAKDKRICAVTAAMQSGTGLDNFARLYHDRFFDVGIAEGHAVTMCGGLSKQGMIPVCAIYSTFLQRSYDMILHDICLMNQHVVFAIDRAGLVGEDGETHQGIYDVGMLLQMPNITVLAPSSISEIPDMLKHAIYGLQGPVAIRYPRGSGKTVDKADITQDAVLLRHGEDTAIVTYGRLVSNALEAADLLADKGISAGVIRLIRLTDINVDKLISLTPKARHLFVVEECVPGGCIASRLALTMSVQDLGVRVVPINLGTVSVPHASVDELMSMFRLDTPGIAARVMEVIHGGEKGTA